MQRINGLVFPTYCRKGLGKNQQKGSLKTIKCRHSSRNLSTFYEKHAMQ